MAADLTAPLLGLNPDTDGFDAGAGVALSAAGYTSVARIKTKGRKTTIVGFVGGSAGGALAHLRMRIAALEEGTPVAEMTDTDFNSPNYLVPGVLLGAGAGGPPIYQTANGSYFVIFVAEGAAEIYIDAEGSQAGVTLWIAGTAFRTLR